MPDDATTVRGRFSMNVESPFPGVWPPNIHVHTHGALRRLFPGSFYWDFETRSFPDMPDALREIVYSWPGTEGALADAYAILGEEWHPWPRYR
jgi:hypothetical protein